MLAPTLVIGVPRKIVAGRSELLRLTLLLFTRLLLGQNLLFTRFLLGQNLLFTRFLLGQNLLFTRSLLGFLLYGA